MASLEAGATWTLTEDIELTEPIVINKNLTIDLNDNNVTCDAGDVFVVTDGTLTLNGNGTVWGSSDNSSSACAVWAKENGKVIINGGTYKVGDDGASKAAGSTNWRNDCIYARDNAQITVNGGEFMYTGENPAGHTFLLNQKDKTNAKIVVTGGKFHKFNPAASNGENPVANFVAEGYESTETAEDVYTVAMRTPAGKYWITSDIGEYRFVLDLGGTAPQVFVIAESQEDAFPDEPGAKGIWMQYTAMGISKVLPKDVNSGKIVLLMQGNRGETLELEMPYTYTSSTICSFDLSNVFDMEDFIVSCEFSTFENQNITVEAGGMEPL